MYSSVVTIVRDAIVFGGRCLTGAGLLSVAVALAADAQTRAASEAERAIFRKWQPAVATVRLVVKTRMVMDGREVQSSEDEVETPATILDPSGLAIVSLAALNPAGMLQRIMANMSGGQPKMDVESTPGDVRLRFANSQEVPARVVLRDTDLGLAFVKPAEGLAAPAAALDMSDGATAEVLDEVIILSRLGKAAGWEPSAIIDRIQAVVTTPRRFYVPATNAPLGGWGVPVFSLDGKPIGVLLMRLAVTEGRIGPFAAMTNPGSTGLLPMILPASDIAAAARQAAVK
jgi:hypothetical protein